jgi:hypothetical protein
MYPTIHNCYVRDTEIARLARENIVPEELRALEAVLEDELDDEGNFRRGLLGEQAIDEAEGRVMSAAEAFAPEGR